MSLYSSDVRLGSIGGPTHGDWHPFIVYARIVPVIARNRRREYWHDMERKAQAVEDVLLADGFKIAVPVAYTPTFRQAPARLTIVGFWNEELEVPSGGDVPVANPLVPQAKVIHSGTVEGEKTSVLTPINGTQTWGDNPTTQNQLITKHLKAALEASFATIPFKTWALTIFYMDVDSVKYGWLPNKKGFFSFPL